MRRKNETDTSAFGGGATRVLSNNELNGLLAEDARNAPATIAHPSVVRRSSRSDATPPPEDERVESAPPDPAIELHMPADEVAAGDEVAAAPDVATLTGEAAAPELPPAPVQPGRRLRVLWLILAIVAVAAALFALATQFAI